MSLFLTESGKIYSFGDNEYGQCGQGEERLNIFDVGRVQGLDNEIVKKVCCGFEHGMCLTKSNNVYGWGKSTRGQLGSGERDNVKTPILIEELCSFKNDKVIDISCGFSNGLALTSKGKVYTWGKFQSLKPNFKKKIYEDEFYPRLINFNKKIKRIHSHMYISCLEDENGDLYMYGLRDALTTLELIKQGKLRENNGLTRMVHSLKPVNMSIFKNQKLKKILCGDSYFIAITNDGVVYKWDWINPPTIMKECENLIVNNISIGWRHTLLSAKPRE